MSSKRAGGATLIELIVAMVIMSVVLAGLTAAFATTSRAGADPVVTRQMLAIAESMMEEVLLQPYGPPESLTFVGPPRETLDSVGKFNGYSSHGVYTAHGDPVPGLDGYNVAVAVNDSPLCGVASGCALKVTVTVTRGSDSLALNGWRTKPSKP